MSQTLVPLFPDSLKRPPTTIRRVGDGSSLVILRDAIPVGWFAAGCILVGTLVAKIPYLPTILPMGLLLSITLYYPIRALLIHNNILHNSVLDKVTKGNILARLPGHVEGEKSPEICVVLLSSRCNGALGLLDPTFKRVGESFTTMLKDLLSDPHSGLLNADPYLGTHRKNCNTIMTIFYFESAECVMKWARRGLHNSVWMTISRNPEKYSHIELAHEMFTVKEGGFEAVYFNTERHGAGELYESVQDVGKEGKIGEVKWRSTVFSKEKGSSSKSRMAGGR